jgi:signal transduction histidine kinase
MMMLLHLRSYKLSQQHHAELRELDGVRREAEFERKRHLEDERFISMLTHELKTPISVAKIILDMSGIDGKERDRIERALKNMTDVVERCRISSAMEDSRLQLDKTTFSVPDAIDGALSLLGRPERVKFFEVNEVLVDSDSQLCGIVISNLLDNALKYSPTNSPISIRYAPITHEGKLGVSIFVANEVGAGGLPDPARMFTKYYRAKTAASKSGSGLGLYISAGIAQILGGFLRYQTLDNQLEFEFWLPA